MISFLKWSEDLFCLNQQDNSSMRLEPMYNNAVSLGTYCVAPRWSGYVFPNLVPSQGEDPGNEVVFSQVDSRQFPDRIRLIKASSISP